MSTPAAISRRAVAALPALLAAAAAIVAWALLWAAWCAFTWGKFHHLDYAKYTNALWNAGRGDGFRMLVDGNYLTTHLSFSLALVGAAFRLWDHPFLLAVAQWVQFAAGAGILAWSARRRGVPAADAAAIALFFCAYPFAQAALLSEYHGVSSYFLLLPWLFHALRFSPRTAWLPLVLLLGVREDAFVVALPVLVLGGWGTDGRRHWCLAAASLLYGLLALFVIYPALAGGSLASTRGGGLTTLRDVLASFGDARLAGHLRAAILTVLPLLAYAGRGRARALLAMPALPFLVAQCSGFPRQQALQNHYATAVHVCVALGLVLAATPRTRGSLALASDPAPAAPAPRVPWRALALTALVVAAHRAEGFLPGARRHYREYRTMNPAGLATLAAARQIPASGLLLTSERLDPFCANRRDLLIWRTYDPSRHQPDLIFETVPNIPRALNGSVLAELRAGVWGVRFHDGKHLILERGADPSRNAALLATLGE